MHSELGAGMAVHGEEVCPAHCKGECVFGHSCIQLKHVADLQIGLQPCLNAYEQHKSNRPMLLSMQTDKAEQLEQAKLLPEQSIPEIDLADQNCCKSAKLLCMHICMCMCACMCACLCICRRKNFHTANSKRNSTCAYAFLYSHHAFL